MAKKQENMKTSFVASVHSDYLPFVEIASEEELGKFIKAQICLSKGEPIPELTGIAKALFDTHTALLERLEENSRKKSEAGKLGGNPSIKNNQSQSEPQAEVKQRLSNDKPPNNQSQSEPQAEVKPVTVSVTVTETNNSEDKSSLVAGLRQRYEVSQLSVIDNFFDVLRHTRKSAKLAESVIIGIYQDWSKHEAAKVIYALRKYIDSPQLHDKNEKYVLGIIRNTNMSDINRNIQSASANKNYDGDF